jgi:lipopolysaccharide transport system ATP-binding protein
MDAGAVPGDVVISVEGLGKEYRLGAINHGMLYRDLQSWWARLRGQPDPNTQVDEHPLSAQDAARMHGDRFQALDDISFEVRRGEILGIIGRNGAGKSTLLKVLSRITSPTRGAVRVKGRVASLLEVGTGFHPELTGRENVFLNGAILGMSKQEISRNLDEIVDFSEIGQFIDTPVKRYSSGMYVRLAFAVAAYLDPEILIVDEVLAVGDLAFQRKCLGKMQLAGRAGRTVLFVSHNLTAVNQLCTRCLMLSGGKLIKQGPSSDVVSYYVESTESNRTASREYPRPGGDFDAKIRKVSVVDAAGRVAPTVDLSEGFSVVVEYELAKPVTGLVVGLQIIAVEGSQTLMALSDPELDWSRLEQREAGYYRAQVDFPAMTLNTGPYQVRVGASIRFKIFDVSEDVSFEILDKVGIVQPLGYERKNSLLALQLPWNIERIADQALVAGGRA